MSEQEPAGVAIAEDEDGFEAPERGSAEELFEHGATGELGPMRHSAAHILAEAVLDLFPGTKLGHRAGHHRRLLLRLPGGPPVHARRPRGDRGADAREHRRRPSVRPEREVAGRSAAPSSAEQDQPFKVEIVDDLVAASQRDGDADAADHLLPAGPVHRPLPRPARREHRPDRPVQAAGGRRRVLARRREAPDAPAHLRHGLGDAGGARPVPVAARRGEEARPPQARRRSSTCSASTTSRRAPRSGIRRASSSGARSRARCASSSCGAATRRSARRSSSRTGCGASPGTGTTTTRTCSSSSPRTRLFSLKPMNCPESTFIYRSKLRSYRDLPLRLNEYGRLHRNERSGSLSGLTRVRQFIQDDAHIYVRPDQLGDEIEALLGEVREAYGWVGLEPRFAFATKPDKAIGDPALWDRAEALIKEALDRSGVPLRREAQGRHVLRPQDRHLHRRRARPRMADGDDPGGPDDAARAVRPDLHRRGGPAAAPDRHPSRHLRLAGAVHRDPRRALRRRVPALAGARPGDGHPDRRPPHRGGDASWPALLRDRGLRVEVDDSVQPDAEQDPRSRRSRRCRTWWSSATARSRRGRRRRGRAPGSSRSPRRGRPSPTGSPPSPPPAAQGVTGRLVVGRQTLVLSSALGPERARERACRTDLDDRSVVDEG